MACYLYRTPDIAPALSIDRVDTGLLNRLLCRPLNKGSVSECEREENWTGKEYVIESV